MKTDKWLKWLCQKAKKDQCLSSTKQGKGMLVISEKKYVLFKSINFLPLFPSFFLQVKGSQKWFKKSINWE